MATTYGNLALDHDRTERHPVAGSTEAFAIGIATAGGLVAGLATAIVRAALSIVG